MAERSTEEKFKKIRESQEGLMTQNTDYLYCDVCRIHVPCQRVPSGGWEVHCPGCSGECAFCNCYLKRFCFGSREQFPPFQSPPRSR